MLLIDLKSVISIEIKRAFFIRARFQKELITAALFCDLRSLLQKCRSVALVSVIRMGDHIFDHCERAYVVSEISHDHHLYGGNDSILYL